MSEKLIGFTDDEIKFATSVLEFARTKLQEQHDASHSGVEQLIINSWIISTIELLSKFVEANLPEPEPVIADEELPERPEA
jgi:hypothetical protein